MSLTSKHIDECRSLLQSERARIMSNVTTLQGGLQDSTTEETEENGLETHMADQGTDTFLRERDLSLEEHESHLIVEIDAALERVEKGTYGTCEVDGSAIGIDRLRALPWARHCLEHAPS